MAGFGPASSTENFSNFAKGQQCLLRGGGRGDTPKGNERRASEMVSPSRVFKPKVMKNDKALQGEEGGSKN